MQMQKGICVKLKDSRSIFILPNGQFMKGQPATELDVGEEGYFYPLAAKKNICHTAIWAPVLVAVSVFALLFSLFAPQKEAYAYVQVQINPGVELGVDKDGDTISLRGLNNDGKKLAAELKGWENEPLDQVLNKVISLSVNTSTEEITITTVKGKDADLPLEAEVKAVSFKAVTDHVKIQLKKATKAQWRRSIEENVPVSQLVADTTVIQSGKPIKEKEKEKVNDANSKSKKQNKAKKNGKGEQKEKESKANEPDKNRKNKNHPEKKQKAAQNKQSGTIIPKTKKQKNDVSKANEKKRVASKAIKKKKISSTQAKQKKYEKPKQEKKKKTVQKKKKIVPKKKAKPALKKTKPKNQSVKQQKSNRKKE